MRSRYTLFEYDGSTFVTCWIANYDVSTTAESPKYSLRNGSERKLQPVKNGSACLVSVTTSVVIMVREALHESDCQYHKACVIVPKIKCQPSAASSMLRTALSQAVAQAQHVLQTVRQLLRIMWNT